MGGPSRSWAVVPSVLIVVFAALYPGRLVAALDVSVVDYGAVGDGQQLCTEAFRRAIADIAAVGGGVLRVPAGTFFTGSISLTSHFVLWLAHGATLKADTDRQRLQMRPLLPALPAYGPDPMPEWMDPRKPQADLRDAIPRAPPLLHGVGLENVTITGENGTLDGQGVDWWERWLSEPLDGRPHLVQFEKSRGVRFSNITLVNPGFWAVHLWLCQYVVVRFLTVLVIPWDPPVRPTNTDGVNPDSSSHVLIEDSYFQTGDDAVAIKSGWDCFGRQVATPAKNITIRRVKVRLTRGCNAAGVAVGSEMSGGVDGVLIEDCNFINTGAAVEVKVGAGRGGYVRNVLARNLTIGQTARGALVVMATYPEPNPFCSERDPPAPDVSNVAFEHINVLGPTRGNLVQLQGTKEVFLKNISVSDVVTEEYGYGAWSCSLVSGVGTRNRPRECAALRKDGSGSASEGERAAERPAESSFSKWWSRMSPPAPQPPPPPVLGGRVWRNDGRCGFDFRADEGQPGTCPTTEEFEAEATTLERRAAEVWLRDAPCCATSGWCGNRDEHCSCYGCVDFRQEENKAASRPAPRRPHARSREDRRPPRARPQQGEGVPSRERPWWNAQQQSRPWRRPQATRPPTPPKRPSRAQSQPSSASSQHDTADEQRAALAAVAAASRAAEVPEVARGGGPARESVAKPGAWKRKEPPDELPDDAVASLANSAAEPPVRGLITSLMFALVVFMCGLFARRYLPAARRHCLCVGGLGCLALSPYISILLQHAVAPAFPDEALVPKRTARGPARPGKRPYTAKAARPRPAALGKARSAPKQSPHFQIPAPRSSGKVATSAKGQDGRAASERRRWRSQVAPKAPGIGDQTGAATTLPAMRASSPPPPPVASSASAVAAATKDCWPKTEVSPLDFGGVGDGLADDTEAVRSCLAYISRCRGTDAVLGPTGRQFYVRPGELQARLHDVTIRFEGELLGPTLREWNPRYDVWPAGSCAYGEADCTPGQGQSPEFVRSQWTLLHIVESSNVTIVGPGGLRAPGRSFWIVRNRRPEVRGYCLLKFDRSKNVRVRGLALTDSPMYQLVIMNSVNIDLRGLSIVINDETVGEGGPHNTDGVSVIASQDVRLCDSEVESGDDNVVIKEGTRNVAVENVTLFRGKGVSIGSLGERAAEDQFVADIVFRNVSLDYSLHGARIKTWIGAHGLVRNVSFENFRLHNVAYGVLIDQKYCPRSQRPEGCTSGEEDWQTVDAINIEDVRFRNFSGTYMQKDRQVACARCKDVVFRNVRLQRSPDAPEPRSAYGYY